MNSRGSFERILTSLHDTLLDEANWEATSALINEAIGSKGNCLVSGDGVTQEDIEIFFAWICVGGQRRPELERLYFDVYYAIDERMPRIRQLPDSQIVHISSLYTETELKTSPAYNEALAIADCRDGLNVRLDGPHGSRITLMIGDPIGGDGWSFGQMETIGRLLPHLRQFVRVRQALTDARALGSTVKEGLNKLLLS